MVFMSRSTRTVSTINRATVGRLAKHNPNGVSLLPRVVSGPRLDDGWAKVQPAVILISKCLRRLDHGFKSHPTDWEKPGIEPGPPWFTRHMLPEMQFSCLRPCSLAITSTVRVVLWFFRSIGCSTSSGSGFKASQKTGSRLKASSDRLVKSEIEPATPGLQDKG